MLFISRLNQEDLCAITWKCSASISVPQLYKIYSTKSPWKDKDLSQGHNWGGLEPQKLEAGRKSPCHRHYPNEFFRAGRDEEQVVTSFPLRRTRLKKFTQRTAHMSIGGGGSIGPTRCSRDAIPAKPLAKHRSDTMTARRLKRSRWSPSPIEYFPSSKVAAKTLLSPRLAQGGHPSRTPQHRGGSAGWDMLRKGTALPSTAALPALTCRQNPSPGARDMSWCGSAAD